ncbi:MAG: hypothetical protein ACLQIB_33980 [Isosphaeraceae bacterium]
MAASFSSEQIDHFGEACGSRMPENEVQFLRSVQRFIEEAIHGGLGFVPVAKTLRQNIKGIVHHRINLDGALRFDLDAARAAGKITPLDADQLKALCHVNGGPMSEREVEFLRDIQGIIDYTIRNDLGLALVVGMLRHDLDGLVEYNFSLEAADADCFLPTVSGFAGNNENSVGAPEDWDN